MRSLIAISVVILVCFMDHSYGTFVEFLSNLPMEISRAFSIAWGSMEDAIKQPVKIVRIGPGGKLKTTTVATKVTKPPEKTEWLPERQINWQPEQVTTWPPSRRVEWHIERKPTRKFELTQELKRKLEWEPRRKLKQQNEQQHEKKHEPQLEQPHEWPRKWQPVLECEPQPEQKPQKILKENRRELKLESPKLNHTLKLESHNERQPEQLPERQPDKASNETYTKLFHDITEFRKRNSKLTIPFLEKPKNTALGNNIMGLFDAHNYRINRW